LVPVGQPLLTRSTKGSRQLLTVCARQQGCLAACLLPGLDYWCSQHASTKSSLNQEQSFSCTVCHQNSTEDGRSATSVCHLPGRHHVVLAACRCVGNTGRTAVEGGNGSIVACVSVTTHQPSRTRMPGDEQARGTKSEPLQGSVLFFSGLVSPYVYLNSLTTSSDNL